jgi:hypothetical protein
MDPLLTFIPDPQLWGKCLSLVYKSAESGSNRNQMMVNVWLFFKEDGHKKASQGAAAPEVSGRILEVGLLPH